MTEHSPQTSRRRVLRGVGTTSSMIAVAGCGSGPAESIETGGETTAATGVPPDRTFQRGHVPQTADQAGIESLDQPGATILLEPNTTYTIDDPPLTISSENVSILGSRSSVIGLPDGTMSSNCCKEMRVEGKNAYFDGWTFDGNADGQDIEDPDTYGIWFAREATHATIANVHNLDAIGDGFGDVREGSRIVNCYVAGATEGCIHYKGSGTESAATVANCVLKGTRCFQINDVPGSLDGPLQGLQVANCDLYAPAESGVMLNTANTVIRDVQFSNVRIDADTHAAWVLGDGEILDVTFTNCHIRSRNKRAFNMGNDHQPATNFGLYNCTLDGAIDGMVVQGAEGFDADRVRIVGEPEDWIAKVRPTATDTRLDLVDVDVSNVIDKGTRTALNGWGHNEGDPNSDGDWNGNGYEGVSVLDVDSEDDATYDYVNGDWR